MDLNTYDVFLEPGSRYESFIPSVDFNLGDRGYLVVVVNGQYDSFGPSGQDYQVIDAYPTLDEAKNVAQQIADYEKAFSDYNHGSWRQKTSEPKLDIKLADGTAYPHSRPPWVGWGNRLEDLQVIRFQVEESPRIIHFN